MREIARRASVSPTTVAHVLNDTPGAQVAEKTRKKVRTVAEKLGYQKSLLSRSIKNPLRHLGIAVAGDQAEPSDTFDIFEGIRAEALGENYFPVIQPMPTRQGRAICSQAVERMVELHGAKLIDGFIIDKESFPTASIVMLCDQGVHVVTVNGSPAVADSRGRPIPSVVVDTRSAGRLATKHLLDLGHERIGLVRRPYLRYKPRFRPYQVAQHAEGYRQALREAHVPIDEALIADGDRQDRQRTYGAVAALMTHARPTALVVGDDVMALMVMQKLKLLNLRVPADVSVVGYGDWALPVRLAEPELTTVAAPLRKNGRLAARMLIDLLENGDAPQRQVSLQPRLVVRQSTAPASRNLIAHEAHG